MKAVPDKDLLLAACRGLPTEIWNPVLDAAAELTLLHQDHLQTPACGPQQFEYHRRRLMQAIDRWIAFVTPVPFANVRTRTRTRTVSQVVDQIAELAVFTYMALPHAPEPLVYDAKVRLDDIGNAYQDLVNELLVDPRRSPAAALTSLSVPCDQSREEWL